MVSLFQPKDKETIDVLAYGNALVDILVRAEDSFLVKHKMNKGGMNLVDYDEFKRLEGLFKDRIERSGGSADGLSIDRIQRSGGSAANTAVTIATLGGRVGFVGKVANDALGSAFTKDLKKERILFSSKKMTLNKDQTEGTGSCLVVVTPDSQRTMNTYLGVAPILTVDDVDQRLIRNAQLSYFEGYLWDNELTKRAISKAMEYAASYRNEVAFTLSDAFCVERHRDEFLSLIDNYVNLVFANEDEALSLFQCKTLDEAIDGFRKISNIAVITRSEKGSIIVVADGEYNIKAEKDLNVVDTTGAGDLYAGGFLYGYIRGLPLDQCGQIGTIAASEVIQHIGARPESNLKDIIAERGFE